MSDKYIIDFISGMEIKAKPEEIDSVQVFSKQLVEDYNYPKNCIQTRPQFRVKVRPSDKKKEYPIDIAIFETHKKNENEIKIIVECKKKNIKDGISQLQDYLRFSTSELGVWFNGKERVFLRKIEKKGKIYFEKIPNIPKYGETIEDIGNKKRRDLKPTHNLRSTFKAIRNHLAANTVGATRDEVLAQQLINLIFCKIYDERFTEPDDTVKFRASIQEDPDKIKKRIDALFHEVKRKYRDVLNDEDNISLDPNSLIYVIGELQDYCLIDVERDIISDAFEVFIGHALKGEQGQFFTPRNVTKMIIEILNPSEDDLIIDPACGTGGFLVEALRYVWEKLDSDGKKLRWSQSNLHEEKMNYALKQIKGIDKDYFLSKVTKAYMAIIGDGKSGVYCDDSLEVPKNFKQKTKNDISLDQFDVLITNPPFGSKIPVRGEEKLSQFELGHAFSFKDETWQKGKLKEKEAPQILFIERCIQLLKEGGRMGIVLPDGILGNDRMGYIREYIQSNAKLLAIIDLPKEAFMPNTPTKTSVIILEKNKNKKKDYPVFMAIAETCGHDRRGNKLEDDDISQISSKFKDWYKKNKT
jgi:type I restriction enzyme M protein